MINWEVLGVTHTVIGMVKITIPCRFGSKGDSVERHAHGSVAQKVEPTVNIEKATNKVKAEIRGSHIKDVGSSPTIST